jgi:multimeric flavodoxin WrbA
MDNSTIILLGSNRKNSNTKKFVSDTYSSSYHLIDLLDHVISPYNYEGVYPAGDGFNSIIRDILKYDIIVFATPVYWYAMSGLMKTFFDRLTDSVTINKAIGRKLKGKLVRVLVVGADAALPAGFEIPFKCTAQYFDMQFDGCIYRETKD